jgi:LPS-assembly protein
VKQFFYSMAIMTVAVSAAWAQQPTENAPVLLEARELGYDETKGIVVANGDVEVVQNDTVLRAEKIVYYQNSGLVRASGNVSVLQPSGDVFFADAVELKDDLKSGVVQQFKARLADNSVFVAKEGVRRDPYHLSLKKARYSPCNICTGKAPFWELIAKRVDIDDIDEKVTHEDAQMNLMGVPIFYTPVLSHPTPDAQAKSGFLIPEYSQSSQLGSLVKAPYYWRISPNQDATITPWMASEDGPLLAADYARLEDFGKITFSGSITYPEKRSDTGQILGDRELRGHIYGNGVIPLSDEWNAGFDIARASDDTYLRRYGFGSQRVLFSRAYAERVDGRNYAIAQGLSIQGLRATDDPDRTPLVLPTLAAYYETKPGASGMQYFVEGNAQSLTRQVGADQHRLSVTTGAKIPVITDGGHVFTGTVSLRNDLYRTNDVSVPGNPSLASDTQTRTIPQAALEWRYPLMRRFEKGSVTVEPVVLAVVQPSGLNAKEIPNEDSTLVELTDTNLFSINRFPGLDAVDSGSRLAYGLRSQYAMPRGDAVSVLFGQNFNADNDTPFPNSDEVGEKFSDYIGRVAYDSSNFGLGYRFALDQKTFAANRNEIFGRVSRYGVTLSGAYLSIEESNFLPDSEEAYADMSAPLWGGWNMVAGARRDLTAGQYVSQYSGLNYQNECFSLLLNAQRSFTRDRDIEPGTTFSFRVGFKNLGEFGDEAGAVQR